VLIPKNLSVKEFSEKIKSDKSAVIIDMRTSQEYEQGHIQNSLLIDMYHPSFQKKILELEKTKNYYIYCRSGSRSFHAGNFMLQMGFENVSHLEKGIISWDKTMNR
jgi:rhodanese-related sulfurtransferase